MGTCVCFAGCNGTRRASQFDISDPSETTYVASGRVDGTVQDQFSISEFNEVIRVATTEDAWGRWWLEGTEEWTGPTNNVFTLAVAECMIPEGCDDETSELVQIGHVGDIAPDERIWSARFVGDRAYLVTFEIIDPLWVIDLTNPTDPVILGELEVPGVSTYIHPVDSDTLLTIGIGPGPDGLGLDWSMTQVSLFDVSDPTNPTLADSLQLSPAYEDDHCDEWGCGWSWSYSEATYEHKAFTYWAPEQLLAVPLSTYRYIYEQIEFEDKTYTYSGYEFVSTLELINVDGQFSWGTTSTLSQPPEPLSIGLETSLPWSSWNYQVTMNPRSTITRPRKKSSLKIQTTQVDQKASRQL